MSAYLWPLLLPVAALSGWVLAKKSQRGAASTTVKPRTNNTYVQGINYLINEQPDKAIDVFLKMLEVDQETVETHLALGGLFRRRGEVERAIRIHQNLIARPQLTPKQRAESLLALGCDYMCAGVFDRAERIFKEAASFEGAAKQSSLTYLVQIYQQEKEWNKALEMLQALKQTHDDSIAMQIAHCYCELAQEEFDNGHMAQAYQYVKQAQKADKNLVRASILRGQIEVQCQHYKEAIKAYKKVVIQDPDFLSEVIKPLHECYKKIGKMEQFIAEMYRWLEVYPRISIVFMIASHIRQRQGIDLAIDFVTEQLSYRPSLPGLKQLIEWYLAVSTGKVQSKIEVLYQITETMLEGKPGYRCQRCGFSGKYLRWFCPSCKNWSTIKPICGVEGE